MNENKILEQEKKGIQFLLNENIDQYDIERKPMIDNGFGVMVDDPYGKPNKHKIYGRISHESAVPLSPENIAAGLSTNMSRFLLVDGETVIYQNDIITNYLGKRWRIGIVDPLEMFQEIIAFQAPIMEAGNITGST